VRLTGTPTQVLRVLVGGGLIALVILIISSQGEFYPQTPLRAPRSGGGQAGRAAKRSPPDSPPDRAGQARVRLPQVRLCPPPAGGAGWKALARGWRLRALESQAFQRRLISGLEDPRLFRQVREVIALILGSIPSPRARAALADLLGRGGDPAWLVTLILALGQFDAAEDPFAQESGAPYVVRHSSGLLVREHQLFEDRAVLDTLKRCLIHVDVAVRRASIQALRRTLAESGIREPEAGARATWRAGEAVRQAFLELLEVETMPEIRVVLAHELAAWAADAPSARERNHTLSKLIEVSLLPEESGVRLRIGLSLQRAPLTSAQLARLRQALEGDDFDTRTWSIDILAAQVFRLRGSPRRVVRELLIRTAEDPDPKIREAVARILDKLDRTERLLIGLLSDPAWHVRVTAARALGGRRSPAVRRALERVRSEDRDWHVRQAALRALRQPSRQP